MTAPTTWTHERGADEPLARSWVRLRGVARKFGGRRVLGPVDLELEPGVVCLVEGPNGAGKTTLLQVAAGILAPTSGTVEAAYPALYLPVGGGARPEQTANQVLAWVARATPRAGMPTSVALELVGLADHVGVRVAALSSGQRARLSLALALVAGPAVVCLDEPTAHLDNAGVRRAVAAIQALAEAESAVLVAAPEPGALRPVADGRVRLDGGMAEVAT